VLSIIEAIFLGFVQGFTEWLPISSSGHLVLFQQFFSLEVPVLFDIVVHLGTLLALAIVIWRDIFSVLSAFSSFNFHSESGRLLVFLFVGTLATGLFGYFFGYFLLPLFNNLFVIGIGFIFTGFLLVLSRINVRRSSLGFFSSVAIGLLQGVSIIPGVSRSGSTISTALFFGISRESAARYSLLLSFPAIIGAFIFDIGEIHLTDVSFSLFFLGFLSSFVFGYFGLRLLFKTLSKKKFHLFSYYCFGLGILSILFGLLSL